MDSNNTNTPFESIKSEIFDSFDVDETEAAEAKRKRRKNTDKSKNKQLKNDFTKIQSNIEFDTYDDIVSSDVQIEKNSRKKSLNQQKKKKLFDESEKLQNEYWDNDETIIDTLPEVNNIKNKSHTENSNFFDINFADNDVTNNISDDVKAEKNIRNSIISSTSDIDLENNKTTASDKIAVLKKESSNKKRQKLIRNAKLLSDIDKTNEYFQQYDTTDDLVDTTNNYPLNSKVPQNNYQKIKFDSEDEVTFDNGFEGNVFESVEKGENLKNISSKYHSGYKNNSVENEMDSIVNYKDLVNPKKNKISSRQKRAMLNQYGQRNAKFNNSKPILTTSENTANDSEHFQSSKGFAANDEENLIGHKTVKSNISIKSALQEELIASERISDVASKRKQHNAKFNNGKPILTTSENTANDSEHFQSSKGFVANDEENLIGHKTVKSDISIKSALQEELTASERSGDVASKQSQRNVKFNNGRSIPVTYENIINDSEHFQYGKTFGDTVKTINDDTKAFENAHSDVLIKNELIKQKTMGDEIKSSDVSNNLNKAKSGKLSSRQKRKLINELQRNKNRNINFEQDKLSESYNSAQSDSINSESSDNIKKGIKDVLEKEEKSNIKSSLLYSENYKLSKGILLKDSQKAYNLTDKSLEDNETLDEDLYNQTSSLSKELGNKGIKNALGKATGFSNKSPLSEELSSSSTSSRQDFSKIRKKIANIFYGKKTDGVSSTSTSENVAKKSAERKAAVKAEEKFIASILSKAATSEPHITAGAVIILIVIVFILALFSSCSVMVSSVGNGIISTTYMTDEKEIYDASVYYTKLEADYQAKINEKIKQDENSNTYDEVRYNIDPFSHNPEVLISYLSAQYPGWSFDLDLGTWFSDLLSGLDYHTVKDVEKALFKEQYKLEETTYWEWHYPSADAMFPIRWYVKEYTLVNNDLEAVINEQMDADTKEYYDLLRDYRGNRTWFDSPVSYDWSTVVANLCGYTLEGSTSFSKYSNTSSLIYQTDGSTISSGTIITLPDGLGSTFTYMGWQTITSPTSSQYQLREQAGMNFDAEGFGVINNRYVVAVTSTFGSIGDYIDVYQSDGTVFPCIIGDIKSQGDSGANKWGHLSGQNVIEFIVDKDTWYNGHANPGTSGCHPEWGNKTIAKIANIGTYRQGEPAPNGGIEEGVISSSQLVGDLSIDVTPHKGIDIAGTSDTKVFAIFDGVVVTKTSNTVSIKSTDEEYQVIYDSITNISVSEGQEISVGDEIGTMTDREILRNNTGGYISESSLGVPHLHLEIRSISENQQYNPYFYIAYGNGDAPQIIIGGNNAVGEMVAGDSETGNRVVELALSRVGYIYLWGGGHSEAEVRNPNSTRFDCSGLVCWAFCQAGSYIGVHNTTSLATMGKPIEYSQMQAGDIVLWSSNGALSGVHHVAIYIGGGQIVEAPYDGQPISTRPVYDKNQIFTIRRLYND